MMTLLLAELSGSELAPATAKALTAIAGLSGDVHILVAGSNIKPAAESGLSSKVFRRFLPPMHRTLPMVSPKRWRR